MNDDNDNLIQGENPYKNMYERLHKEPPIPPPSEKVMKTSKTIIILFDVFTIIAMWLFSFQFSMFTDNNSDFRNPAIPIFTISIISSIFLTPLIIIKSIHGFDDQPLNAIFFMDLLMFSIDIMLTMAFFVPFSYVYVFPFLIIVALLFIVVKRCNFNFFKKLLIILIVIAFISCALLNSMKNLFPLFEIKKFFF